MTRFRNHNNILDSIILELSNLSYAKSWNIVVPPAFYPEIFASELNDKLKVDIPHARVALVAADGVASTKDLFEMIHYQWMKKLPCKSDWDSSPNVLLAELLNNVGEGLNVLIISEFHRILGRLDERVLVALRTAEQAGKIHTLAISMYPHRWIKEKWKREGHLLNVSNYGDHKQLDVEPYSYCEIAELLNNVGLPSDFSRLVYEWTGGFPQCIDRVVEVWKDMGQPILDCKTEQSFRKESQDAVARFVKCIDSEDSSRFSSLILNLYQHINEAQSYEQISRFHPWARIILDDVGLRSEMLGDALTSAQLERDFHAGTLDDNINSVAETSIRYYNSCQYDLTILLALQARKNHNSNRLYLIELHARIMEALRGGVSRNHCPDVDTEWLCVIKLIGDARSTLSNVVENDRKKCMILERYDEIEALAKAICSANNDVRLLDTIGGLYGGREDRKTALTLAVFQFESAKGIRGNTGACKTIMELPEQLIRLWGFWKHKLNYYSAPHKDEELRTFVKKCWPGKSASLNFPNLGSRFPSIKLFFYYLYAIEEIQLSNRTWINLQQVEKELSILDTRNNIAHATVCMDASMRQNMFNISEILLHRLAKDCLVNTSYESLLSVVKPLEVY